MSDLSAKFSELETQLATQSATIGGYIDTVEAKLQAIADTLDILNENNAANTKALLAALGQTGACFPCPTPSIVVPPLVTTPAPVNTAFCQRSQAFVHAIHSILAAMDTLQSFNVVGTFSVLNDAISEIINGIISGGSPPLPSFPETVNIVGDYVSYAGERLFSGVGLVDQFSPLESVLTNALFNAGSAEAAQAAFNASIDGSGASTGAKLLFKAVGYSALYSYYFDPGSSPDVSGYDGSLCGITPGSCFTFDLVLTHQSNGNDFYCMTSDFGLFTPAGAIVVGGSTYTSDIDMYYNGNLEGWTAYANMSSLIVAYRTGDLSDTGGLSTLGISADSAHPTTLPFPTGSFFFFSVNPGTVTLCFDGS